MLLGIYNLKNLELKHFNLYNISNINLFKSSFNNVLVYFCLFSIFVTKIISFIFDNEQINIKNLQNIRLFNAESYINCRISPLMVLQ